MCKHIRLFSVCGRVGLREFGGLLRENERPLREFEAQLREFRPLLRELNNKSWCLITIC